MLHQPAGEIRRSYLTPMGVAPAVDVIEAEELFMRFSTATTKRSTVRREGQPPHPLPPRPTRRKYPDRKSVV